MRPQTLALFVSTLTAFFPGVSRIARGGVLLDYGTDAGALNDAGVVRAEGNPNSTFGFEQFQLFNIDPADEAWAIDRVSLSLRLFSQVSTGEASLAIYDADGLVPDLLEQRAGDLAFTVTSVVGDEVRIDLGGLVLESGSYFVGVRATEPTADLLWVAGDNQAFRTARRSDGGFFSGSPRALSLSIEGAVVPASGGVGVLVLAAGIAARRRRT